MADFVLDDIDDVIHGKVRLGIMAFLSTSGITDFTTLRGHLGVTDGNLSTHLRKLEGAGYVEPSKSFQERRPVTHIALTETGRAAFLKYLEAMRKLTNLQAAGNL